MARNQLVRRMHKRDCRSSGIRGFDSSWKNGRSEWSSGRKWRISPLLAIEECESQRLIIRQQLECPAPEDGLNRSWQPGLKASRLPLRRLFLFLRCYGSRQFGSDVLHALMSADAVVT